VTLAPARIAAELAALGSSVGRPLAVVATTGSTNDDARAAAREGAPHGAAFVADAQTEGRGRSDRRWHSPAGENVYLSVLLLPRELIASPALSLAIGLGVAAVVDAHLDPPRARIKWPNDVYVDDKKVAGILVEASSQGAAPPAIVVGVGLNVLGRRFPDGFAAPPTSLALAGGHDLARERVAAELIAAIGERFAAFAAAGLPSLLPELRARDWLCGRRVTVGDVAGVAAGIDAEGRLLVDDGAAFHAITAGEVRVGYAPR
jgi:BirA family biotin operon repressor/biotin-[acetyl-CoA-carboxylase] ligase